MKLKKVLVMLMTLTMLVGASVNVYAYAEYTIPITNANAENVTYDYLQLIKADSKTESGWSFVNNSIAKNYTDAFGITDIENEEDIPDLNEQQKAIWMLILKQTPNTDIPASVTSSLGQISPASDSQIAAALRNVQNSRYNMDGTEVTSVKVNEPGVYYIMGDESKYVYSPMAAYVSFNYSEGGEIDGTLVSNGVSAKKTPNWATKDADQDVKDEVTEIGRTETYTVTSTVPYYTENTPAESRTYWVTDVLNGATYTRSTDADHTDEVKLTVKVGNSAEQTFYGTITTTTGEDGRVKESFTANLSSLVANNAYQNQSITIKYSAEVVDTVVDNDVYLGKAENDYTFGHGEEDLYTGNVIITKYASDEDNVDEGLSDNEKLAGAHFIVYKGTGSSKEYAQFENAVDEDGMNVYKFVDWGTRENADEIITGSEGTAKVEGLDLGTYGFEEIQAPDGYTLNKEDATATIELTDGTTEATAEIGAQTHMVDTSLSALPSTGGIGTTIFTIGGCVIMISAAGLFFVSRRRQENK